MTKDEVLKLAKELDGVIADIEEGDGFDNVCLDTVKYVRDALLMAQPEQEPVAGQPLPCPFCGHIGLDFSDGDTYRWGIASCGGCGASCGDIRREYPDEGKWHPEAIAEWNKRTSLPQRTWVSLTDEDFLEACQIAERGNYLVAFQRIQAKLKEKNT